MLITKDSPLRRLPIALNRPQAMFLEGIRYSMDMAGIAYENLQELLWDASRDDEDDEDDELFPSAFMYAWSIVDSLNRLRVLVEHMPGFAGTPMKELAIRRLQPLKPIRNSVQHMEGSIRESEVDQMTWGSLAWITVLSEDPQLLTSCVMMPGSMKKGLSSPAVNPAGRQLRSSVDHVELTAYGETVSISEAVYLLPRLVKSLNASLGPQFDKHPERAGSDAVVCIEMGRRPRSEVNSGPQRS